MHAKYSEKLLLLTPRYAYVGLHISVKEMFFWKTLPSKHLESFCFGKVSGRGNSIIFDCLKQNKIDTVFSAL